MAVAPSITGRSYFSSVLDRLDASSVNYRLLRPAADEADQGLELDILVWPHERERFVEMAAADGFRLMRQRSPGKEVLGRLTCDGIAYLDVHYAFVQRGLEYRTLEAVAARVSLTSTGRKALPPEDLLLHLYFHNLLGKGGLQSKDLPRVETLLASGLDRAYLDRQFERDDERDRFRQFCADPRTFAPATAAAARAATEMARHLPGVSGAAAKLPRGTRSQRRHGLHIAFMGVDGCGKSTTTAIATQQLEASRLRCVPVYMGPWGHVRSRPLKLAVRLGLFPAKDARSLKSRVAGHVKGWVYYSAVSFELWQRFLTQIVPALRRGRVVLSDRYVYDLRYIYKRRRMHAFPLLRRLVCALFPRPDLIVFLHNDPETIAARKGQLTPAEIEEFQGLYRRALEPYRVLAIKTDQEPAQVAAQIVEQALTMYYDRNVER